MCLSGCVLTPIKLCLMSVIILDKIITHFLFTNNTSKLSAMALCLVQPESWISILSTDSIFIKDSIDVQLMGLS